MVQQAISCGGFRSKRRGAGPGLMRDDVSGLGIAIPWGDMVGEGGVV
jgi:hypothetical protein